jgi:hypothetical protein
LRPKEFGHHLIDCHFQVVIRFFQLPRKGVMSYVLVEGFLKTYDMPPFCGDWNVLITIKRGDRNVFVCRNIGDWNFLIIARLVIDNFGCHKVWQLKNSVPIPCANWKLFWSSYPMLTEFVFNYHKVWWLNFFNHHKVYGDWNGSSFSCPYVCFK